MQQVINAVEGDPPTRGDRPDVQRN
jgi:hypothetical protein